jgi:uncharacterized protein (DUF983 family)
MSSSTKAANGSVKKQVVCEHCGHRYEYEMQRMAIGTVNNSRLTKAEADAEAARIGTEKLQQMLERECDVVPCAQCGAITPEMEKHRKAFFPTMLMIIGAGLGMLGLFYVAWMITGRIFIFGALVGVGAVLLGTFILLTKSKEMLMAGRISRTPKRIS